MAKRGKASWDAKSVRALRGHLGVSQQEMAEDLGVRQQTVSEWETGMYQPRGASSTLLRIIAERAAYQYTVDSDEEETTPSPEWLRLIRCLTSLDLLHGSV